MSLHLRNKILKVSWFFIKFLLNDFLGDTAAAYQSKYQQGTSQASQPLRSPAVPTPSPRQAVYSAAQQQHSATDSSKLNNTNKNQQTQQQTQMAPQSNIPSNETILSYFDMML